MPDTRTLSAAFAAARLAFGAGLMAAPERRPVARATWRWLEPPQQPEPAAKR